MSRKVELVQSKKIGGIGPLSPAMKNNATSKIVIYQHYNPRFLVKQGSYIYRRIFMMWMFVHVDVSHTDVKTRTLLLLYTR